MAIWPFNHKKKQDETLPEEVQEFYESGQKQRTGMAWLLALATLVVTIILAIILFFTGRWIYQQVANNDSPEDQKAQQAENQDQLSTPQSETTTTPNQSSNQQGSSSTNTTQPSTPTPAPTTTPTPNTGSSAPEVPDTGPGPGGLQ